MKIDSKELLQSRRQFIVELTANEVNSHFEHAVTNLAPTIKIAGFRPGKAPANLVRDQVGAVKLREEAYNLAVREAWQAISNQLSVENRKLKAGRWREVPIQDPEVDLTEFEEDQPAMIVFEFDIRPEVKLSDWTKIKLSPTKEEEVTDEDVAKLIASLQRAHAKMVVKLTPAKMGDKVHVSFDGSIGGVRKDKLSSKNFPVILGAASTIPGFDKELVDLKKGDKKTFQLAFPKDHFDQELANQQVDFSAEIEEVFDVILPELNDEFAKQFGHTKTEQLKKAIRKDIGDRKKDEQFINQKARWLAEFEKLVKCELPESLLKAEVERSRVAWRQFMQERHINEGDWLQSRQLTLEQLEKDWHKAAASSVKIGLGLAEVAKELKKELKNNDEFQELLNELVRKAID